MKLRERKELVRSEAAKLWLTQTTVEAPSHEELL